jgi:hypothetical protein
MTRFAHAPFFVARATASGDTVDYSASIGGVAWWMVLLAIFVVWANVVVWGLIGLAVAVGWVVE